LAIEDTDTFRIRFEPSHDIFLSGVNPIPLFMEPAAMGHFSLIAHLGRIPPLGDFNPEECYTYWDAVLTTGAGENAIRDVFIFVEDRARVTVQRIGSPPEGTRLRVGELLVDRGDVTPAEVEKHLVGHPRAGELLVEAGVVSADKVEAVVLEQRHLDEVREKRRRAEAAATLRVPAAKVDGLVDVVGELVTVQALGEREIDALILAPGFSTAQRVTEVSGRGVGMDVVQRSLDSLRGTLSVESTPGHGTEVSLKIPLTLAIIDGLLIEAGGSFFVMPLANISECIELERGGAERRGRESLASVRGELVPYVVLRERFAIPGDPPAVEQVIVAETPAGKFGFVVDRVIGDYHTVIKKLGHLYRHIDEVSGATILGDGRVALILDADKLAAAVIRDGRPAGGALRASSAA